MKLDPLKALLVFAITLVAVVVVGAVNSWLTLPSDKAKWTVDDYARHVVSTCADEAYRPFCYENELPKLTSSLETYQIFDVIRGVRQYDPEYVFCHVAAHNLGQYEVAKDPEIGSM